MSTVTARRVAVPSAARAKFAKNWTSRIVAFGEFIDGYDLLVIGAAMLFLRPYFGLTTGQVGVVSAAAFVGTAVGLLVFGDLSDRFGRRVIFMINLVFFVVASIGAAFAGGFWQLVVVRFVLGLAVGMDIPTSHAFLAEISPRSRRGRIAGSLPNMMWLSGAIVSVVLALLLGPVFGNETWRWLFGLAAIPAAMVLVARQFLPESPRWLLAQGRDDEARRVFEMLDLEPPTAQVVKQRRSYRDLLAGKAWRRLLAVTAFFAIQAFGGAVATVAGPLVLDSTGIGRSNSLYFSLAGFVIGLIAVTAGATIIDRVNRRTLGIWTCLGVFVAGIGIATLGAHSTVWLVVCFIAYSLLTWFGPGVLSWVWSAEAFPTALRGLGSGIAQAATRLAIAANVVLVPTLLADLGLATIGLYACAFLIAAGIVLASPFLATTGRELEGATTP
ncbi:MFS transporter [Actinocrispum wychmicini]|uniref:Putative MFS transporter n=1 Tax=Actinocrispum wychmicini TaxID=1213861 RepID=A0A4R2JL41_9PSEU|nr:MFS transporter [Actinocrispum wychmicini]TCO59894.1 putative MFS transporter [Actinocrispum wychmicini]